jgi:hypothetical protein
MGDHSPGTPAAATETPWELAQRLVAQGLPLPAVSERLLQTGLPSEDVTTLLRALRLKSVATPGERGPQQEPHVLGVLVGVAKAGLAANAFLATGETAAGKRMLTDLMGVTNSFMGAELVDAPVGPAQPKGAPSELVAPEGVAFDVPDGTPCCQVHPRLPSTGTCPRCSALTCHSCAPKKGLGGTEFCAACEQLPKVHKERVRKAARRLAVTLPVEAVVLLALLFTAPVLGTFQSPWGLAIPSEVAVSLLFAALGLAQWLVRHPWPGVVGAVSSGGVILAPLFLSQQEVPASSLLLLLVPLAAILFMLERLSTRRKEWRSVVAHVRPQPS